MRAIKSRLLDASATILKKIWALHKTLVANNSRFKNLHAGETCLIFANGASLKYYDISRLPNYPVIGCSYSLIDKRMQSLNLKYMAMTDSYLFYPILYNTYDFVDKFQINKIARIFRGIIRGNLQVQFFVSVTNFYSLFWKPNVNYIYHFGDTTSGGYDMAGNFASCHGALDIMLGMAKYFGFSKAILIGCDYLGSPPVMGHFYADDKPFTGPYLSDYCSRVKFAATGIDVLVILPKGVSSPCFEFDSYEEYFKLERNYANNIEFIDMKHILWLRAAAAEQQAIMRTQDQLDAISIWKARK